MFNYGHNWQLIRLLVEVTFVVGWCPHDRPGPIRKQDIVHNQIGEIHQLRMLDCSPVNARFIFIKGPIHVTLGATAST